jgi:hypothetical protein
MLKVLEVQRLATNMIELTHETIKYFTEIQLKWRTHKQAMDSRVNFIKDCIWPQQIDIMIERYAKITRWQPTTLNKFIVNNLYYIKSEIGAKVMQLYMKRQVIWHVIRLIAWIA